MTGLRRIPASLLAGGKRLHVGGGWVGYRTHHPIACLRLYDSLLVTYFILRWIFSAFSTWGRYCEGNEPLKLTSRCLSTIRT